MKNMEEINVLNNPYSQDFTGGGIEGEVAKAWNHISECFSCFLEKTHVYPK